MIRVCMADAGKASSSFPWDPERRDWLNNQTGTVEAGKNKGHTLSPLDVSFLRWVEMGCALSIPIPESDLTRSWGGINHVAEATDGAMVVVLPSEPGACPASG